MRRIAYILVGLALVGAATWYCSSDSPAAPKPGSGGGGPTSPSALQIRLFTSNPNPVAGACTVIEAVVTLNGANVPDGTGVSFSTDLATSFFSQNGLPLISVVTQGGTATTALCSDGDRSGDRPGECDRRIAKWLRDHLHRVPALSAESRRSSPSAARASGPTREAPR